LKYFSQQLKANMTMKKYYILFTFLVSALLLNTANAQYSSKKVKSKYQTYNDSLKTYKYDYIFPIWGQGAYKKGFDIPYPVGIMANYMWMKQSIIIDNFQIGLKTDDIDLDLTPVDFIQFGDNSNVSYTANIRPDIWVFPFLNVYGIFGVGQSTTDISVIKPVLINSTVTQDITTAGVGVMTAFGIGPVWVSVDGNWTWNKPTLLDKAVRVNVLGVRMGHTFTFKSRPDRNVAFWIGGMRAKMESETVGQIKLGEAIPIEELNAKGDEVVTLWDDLTPQEKLEPKNIVVHQIGKRMQAADGEAIIKYGMDKQVAEMWNMVVGAQFQLNKNWMLRSETGIVGDRKQFLLSLNYRFKI
jgi:hypothetical protein